MTATAAPCRSRPGECTFASTSAGTKTLTATYVGDTTFDGDADTASHVVDTRQTSTLVLCSPLSIVVAEDTTCTVTVTDTETRGDKSDPEGTVTFSLPDTLGLLDMGTFDPLTADCTLDSDGVAGTYTSSCTVVYTPSAKGDGQHTIDAAYDGSATHTASADTVGVTVQVDWRATSTTVTCETPVVVGQPSTCSVVVADASANGVASDPTGAVAFSLPGLDIGTFTPATAVCTLEGNTDGTSDCQVTYTPTARGDGVHNIGAAYDSDEDVHADSSDATGFPLLVNKADTTTTIDTDDPDPSVVGESVTVDFSVTVDAPGAGSPTGLVTVTDANSLQTCSATVLAGSCEIAFAADGTHHLTATYAGDDDFNNSASTPATDHVVLTRHTSTVVDCTPTSIVVAQLTTCTVTVTDDEPLGTASDPLGTVTFSLPDASAPLDQGTFSPAGTCSLVGNTDGTSDCQVTYTPSAKGDGLHTINAAYGGSTAHTASADTDGVSVTVNHRATTTAVTCDTPVVVGQPSTCTATVDDASANGTRTAPSGSVSFTSDGSGTFTLPGASCTLVADDADTSTCQATYTPTARGTGTHHIGAAYDSDEDVHADSADGDGFDIAVNKAATTITITSDNPDPSVVDQAYTITWTVVVDAPGAGTPTGNVTVGDGDGNSCSGPAQSLTGCSFSSSSAGTKTLTATYAGDDDFNGDSDTELHLVNTRATSTVVECTPSTIVVAEDTTCEVTVSDVESLGTKSDPEGTVTFSLPGTDPGTFSGTTCLLVGNGDDTSTCSITTPRPPEGRRAAHDLRRLHRLRRHPLRLRRRRRRRGRGGPPRHYDQCRLCAPPSIAAGQSSTCTVTVTDAWFRPAAASDPAGTVTLASDGSWGTFTPAGACTLLSDGSSSTATSSCAW